MEQHNELVKKFDFFSFYRNINKIGNKHLLKVLNHYFKKRRNTK